MYVVADDEVFIDIIGKSSSVQIQAIRVSERLKSMQTLVDARRILQPECTQFELEVDAFSSIPTGVECTYGAVFHVTFCK